MCFEQLGRMVRATDKGARSDSPEAHSFTYSLIFVKFLRRDISFHWKSLRPGLEVLSDGNKIAPDRSQILEEVTDLLSLLSQPKHEPRFRGEMGSFFF